MFHFRQTPVSPNGQKILQSGTRVWSSGPKLSCRGRVARRSVSDFATNARRVPYGSVVHDGLFHTQMESNHVKNERSGRPFRSAARGHVHRLDCPRIRISGLRLLLATIALSGAPRRLVGAGRRSTTAPCTRSTRAIPCEFRTPNASSVVCSQKPRCSTITAWARACPGSIQW